MTGDADISAVASLFGDATRASILMALADGRALAASTLANEASVAPSTVSSHLSQLLDGGLVRMEASGRHRYFRLAGPEVADVIETLARLAPSKPISSLRESTRAEALRMARTCYDHLAGRLGVAVTDSLIDRGYVRVDSAPGGEADPVLGPGRAQRFELTACGHSRLEELGVDLDRPGRRPMVRYCVDWSEQRPHISGRLGAALLDAFVANRWVERSDRRVVRTTELGRHALADVFGVDLDVPHPAVKASSDCRRAGTR